MSAASDSLFVNPVSAKLPVGVTKGSHLILAFSDLRLGRGAKQVRRVQRWARAMATHGAHTLTRRSRSPRGWRNLCAALEGRWRSGRWWSWRLRGTAAEKARGRGVAFEDPRATTQTDTHGGSVHTGRKWRQPGVRQQTMDKKRGPSIQQVLQLMLRHG